MPGDNDFEAGIPISYARYHPEMVAAARSIVGNHAVAEEIAQESWLRWWRSSRTALSSAFLRRIVSNAAIDWIRSSRSEAERLSMPQLVGGNAPDPEQVAIDRETVARVQGALSKLPPRSRKVFLLRRVDGLTYGEIGRQMGLSGGRVCQLFKEAVLEIGDILDEDDA
ncbi:MAG: RNA polymerase sigma factor [Pseudomonadota bacterium]